MFLCTTLVILASILTLSDTKSCFVKTYKFMDVATPYSLSYNTTIKNVFNKWNSVLVTDGAQWSARRTEAEIIERNQKRAIYGMTAYKALDDDECTPRLLESSSMNIYQYIYLRMDFDWKNLDIQRKIKTLRLVQSTLTKIWLPKHTSVRSDINYNGNLDPRIHDGPSVHGRVYLMKERFNDRAMPFLINAMWPELPSEGVKSHTEIDKMTHVVPGSSPFDAQVRLGLKRLSRSQRKTFFNAFDINDIDNFVKSGPLPQKYHSQHRGSPERQESIWTQGMINLRSDIRTALNGVLYTKYNIMSYTRRKRVQFKGKYVFLSEIPGGEVICPHDISFKTKNGKIMPDKNNVGSAFCMASNHIIDNVNKGPGVVGYKEAKALCMRPIALNEIVDARTSGTVTSTISGAYMHDSDLVKDVVVVYRDTDFYHPDIFKHWRELLVDAWIFDEQDGLNQGESADLVRNHQSAMNALYQADMMCMNILDQIKLEEELEEQDTVDIELEIERMQEKIMNKTMRIIDDRGLIIDDLSDQMDGVTDMMNKIVNNGKKSQQIMYEHFDDTDMNFRFLINMTDDNSRRIKLLAETAMVIVNKVNSVIIETNTVTNYLEVGNRVDEIVLATEISEMTEARIESLNVTMKLMSDEQRETYKTMFIETESISQDVEKLSKENTERNKREEEITNRIEETKVEIDNLSEDIIGKTKILQEQNDENRNETKKEMEIISERIEISKENFKKIGEANAKLNEEFVKAAAETKESNKLGFTGGLPSIGDLGIGMITMTIWLTLLTLWMVLKTFCC